MDLLDADFKHYANKSINLASNMMLAGRSGFVKTCSAVPFKVQRIK